MSTSFKEFHKRVRRLDRKAEEIKEGYRRRIRKDGLIEIEPRGKSLRKRVPLKYVIGLLAGVIGYKVFLLIRLGEADYVARLNGLVDGTFINKFGAAIMQVDPVTRMFTDLITPLVV